MSFWSKKNNQIPFTNGNKSCFDFIDKINEQLYKIDKSIVYSKSPSGSNSPLTETLSHLSIKQNTSAASPVFGGRISFKNLQVCTAINKEINSDVITGCVEEISKCLNGLKKLILEDNAFYENGNNNVSSFNINSGLDASGSDPENRNTINSNSEHFSNIDWIQASIRATIPTFTILLNI